MTEQPGTTTHESASATVPVRHDEERSSELGRDDVVSEDDEDSASLEADSLPLYRVIDAVHATARARSEALRTRSADVAREILAGAEQQVRDLLAQQLPAADRAERSRDIVARAQREVSETLAQGRNDAEVVAMRAGQRAADLRAQADMLADNDVDADPSNPSPTPTPTIIHAEVGLWHQHSESVTLPGADSLAAEGLPVDPAHTDSRRVGERAAHDVFVSAHNILETGPSTAATDQHFASLRAVALPSEKGGLRYRLSGWLTLATMLVFQQAVSRLPGVTSAKVVAEPDDAVVLSMTTSDSDVVQGLLVCMPGIDLKIEPA